MFLLDEGNLVILFKRRDTFKNGQRKRVLVQKDSFANLPIFVSSFVKAKVAFLLKATFNKTEREREIVTFFVVSVII